MGSMMLDNRGRKIGSTGKGRIQKVPEVERTYPILCNLWVPLHHTHEMSWNAFGVKTPCSFISARLYCPTRKCKHVFSPCLFSFSFEARSVVRERSSRHSHSTKKRRQQLQQVSAHYICGRGTRWSLHLLTGLRAKLKIISTSHRPNQQLCFNISSSASRSQKRGRPHRTYCLHRSH